MTAQDEQFGRKAGMNYRPVAAAYASLAPPRTSARRASWEGNLPEVRKKVQADDRPFFNRQAIAELFGVKDRQASTLLRRIWDRKVDRAYLVSREALITHLDRLLSPDSPSVEVVERLEDLRKDNQRIIRKGQEIEVPIPPPAPLTAVLPQRAYTQALPTDGQAGEIRIQYGSAEDLLSTLLQLAKIAAQNPRGFRASVDPVRSTERGF